MRQHLFFVILFIIPFLNFSLKGQNLKTSHLLWNLPLYNNAALTYSDFSRITADFRSARLSENVSFSSALVWMDYPVLLKNKNTGAFFVMFENEKSGSTIDFNTIRANVAFSKKIMLSRQSHLNFGLGVGYQQFGLSLDGLSTSSQFMEGIGFNPSLPNGELSGFYSTSYFTINSGLFYHATNFRETQLLKIGFSAHNLNKQLKRWENMEDNLPVQYSVQIQYLSFTNSNFAAGPDLVFFNEENKINGIGGLSLRYDINNPENNIQNEEGKYLNAFIRVATQKKGILGFQYKSEKYVVGFSYDIPFGNLTQVYGNAFEVLFSLTPQVKGRTKNKRSRVKQSKPTTDRSGVKKNSAAPTEIQAANEITKIVEGNTDTTKSDSLSINDKGTYGKVKAGEITSQEIPVTLQVNQVYFVFGSSELDESSKKYLEEVYERFLRNGDYKITVIGHTDNVGSEEDNRKLSIKRAEKVYDYLGQFGISSKNIEILGKGEEEPIAPNDTQEGRAKNRRVEILLNRK